MQFLATIDVPRDHACMGAWFPAKCTEFIDPSWTRKGYSLDDDKSKPMSIGVEISYIFFSILSIGRPKLNAYKVL